MSEYEVGYGKTPNATKFKPGQSGNPKGRPKGAKNIATLLDSICNETVVVKENGKERRLTKLEIAMLQLVSKATKGDIRAIEKILDLKADIEAVASEREVRSALFLTTEQECELRVRLQARSATLVPAMADGVVQDTKPPEATTVDAGVETTDASADATMETPDA